VHRPTLILGSSSPRRRELLSVLGLQYEVMSPNTVESPRPGEAPHDYVLRNAKEKGLAVEELAKTHEGAYPHGFIVISADTIVVLGREILEKPRDVEHAAHMLENLSGREHTVFSGVSLRSYGTPKTREKTFVSTTKVRLKTLSRQEIEAYIKTGEPLDKAGGYAAQGIGSYMVERIEGSYANVVGLPISDVVEVLTREFEYPLWAE
jgi:septum formation protein